MPLWSNEYYKQFLPENNPKVSLCPTGLSPLPVCIARGLSLGAVLQRSVGGDVGWNDGDLHGADFYLEPEGEEVQWEHLLHSIILLGPDQSCIGLLYCGDSSDQADYVLE